MFSCKTDARAACAAHAKWQNVCLQKGNKITQKAVRQEMNELVWNILEHIGSIGCQNLPNAPLFLETKAKWKEIRRKVHLCILMLSDDIRLATECNWYIQWCLRSCSSQEHQHYLPKCQGHGKCEKCGVPKNLVNDTCPSLCAPFPDTLIYPEGNHQLTQCPCLLCLQALWVPWLCTGIKNHAHPGEFCLNLNILQLPALLRRDFLKRIQIPIFPSLASCAKQVADSVGFLAGFSEQLGFHRI